MARGGSKKLRRSAAALEVGRRRRLMEEQAERQKAARERSLVPHRSLQGFQHDAQQRQREFEQMETDLWELQQSLTLETESSRKAYYREFKKVIEASDVVLEVLDSRDPLGCRCPQVEQAVFQSGANKRLVLVLNKIDLVAREVLEKWLKYLRNELPTVAFKACTQAQNRNLHRSRVPVECAPSELLHSTACVGADNLMRLLGSYCRSRDVRTTITVGVVGLPNVGKSSLINSLKRARACTVGATPGVTKCLQEVHLDKHIKLLDCPGIVMATAPSDVSVILRNCVKIERLADPVGPVAAILKRCNREQVMQHYNIPEFRDPQEFLALLARRLGKLRKGGLPDHEKAAKRVLSDWTSGRISYYTEPPETHSLPTHLSAEIVSQLGEAFDIEALDRDNQEALSKVDLPEAKMAALSSEVREMEEDVPTEESGIQPSHSESAPPSPAVTVTLGGTREKGKASGQRPLAAPPLADLQLIGQIDPLCQGQALRAAGKRRRRLQKRADKLATKLSHTLSAAMDLSLD
ncbi:guanine nucleotide-binding protein-like 3-like protein isoform X2 [Hemiscyllium ocellatum]|uniref:guanine nucleotide-binding protein-like 3-like protein isoform X2 n=1 Tax=Hemiscyllium ocellatum TaxID=170820 RepID=UPI002965FD5D|nr:guanine nucleotide-binding protein-like 3-like protein isoform X2 [Hemiscyllium ocellatum]